MDEIKFKCGHTVPTYPMTRDGESIGEWPIANPGWEVSGHNEPPHCWCCVCGWVNITQQEYDDLRERMNA